MGKAVWIQKVGEQEEVCIGVRAKYIRSGDGSSNDVYVPGNVERKFRYGLNNYINVRLDRDRIIIMAEKGVEFDDGDAIQLHFSRRNAILFRGSLDNIKRETMPLPLSVV